MKKTTIFLTLALTSSLSFAFDLNSFTKDVINTVTKSTETATSTNTTKSNLDNSTVSNGLKEALKQGVSFAVSTLGKDNGYLNNSLVKIPLPQNLAKAESLIRKAGGDKIADDLILSMNTAATKAAPKTAEIFIKAIEKMSLDDAKKILSGTEHAATDYFKANTTDFLKKMITPIIEETMKQNQVTGYYDTANNFYQSNLKETVESSSVMNMAKNLGVDAYLPGSSEDLVFCH